MNKYKQITTTLLKTLGAPASLLGYQYIKDAVEMVMEDRSLLRGAVTKRLYPGIAKMNGTTSTRVERAIRHAIGSCWDRGDQKLQLKMFGYSVDPNRGTPTNTEFIAALVEYIDMSKFF